MALFFACALVVLVGLLGIIAVVYRRSAVVFTEQLFFVFGIGLSLLLGAYLLAYVQMGNVWDLIPVSPLNTPVPLSMQKPYICCGSPSNT